MSSSRPVKQKLKFKPRPAITLLGSALALSMMAYGLFLATRSPLFLVQVVEIGNLPDHAPVDEAELTRLADVPVGKVSLFQLDLSRIENNVLKNSWIREARIQKRFPQTVSISVTFRQPRALIEGNQGALAYVDQEGTVFGRVTTRQPSNGSANGYPVLAGLPDSTHVRQVLKFLDAWDGKMKDSPSELASITWIPERGYRALVVYPLKANSGAHGRASVDLGQNIDVSDATEPQLERLGRVLDYLQLKSIPARQIWADSGKKIVVRTARGS
jgi:cell division septal protein FtsQ